MSNGYPLSSFQKSIWRGQTLHADSPLYNMVFTFDIYGEIDIATFKQSFNHLVKNSDSLRSVIDSSDQNEIRQLIIDKEATLDYFDFSGQSQEKVDEWILKQNSLIFNLHESSHYSALVKKDANHFTWYINQHHIFCDVYSFQLMLNKLSGYYTHLSQGKELILNKADNNEHTKIASNLDTKNQQENKSNYSWSDPITLYGYGFKDKYSTSSKRIEFTINRETISAIHAKLNSLKLATLSKNLNMLSFLASSLSILLHQIGNKGNHFEFSSIFSSRFSSKSKELLLPQMDVRHKQIDMIPSDKLNDIYSSIISFLISASNTKPSTSTVPGVIFNMFNLDITEFAGFKTEPEWLHPGHMDAHHFIRLHIIKYKKNDEYSFAFDIKDGFDLKGIENRLVDDFKNMIHQLVASKELLPINEITLIDTEQFRSLTKQALESEALEFNQTDLLVNKIYKNLEIQKENIALYYEEKQINYQTLHKKAAEIATSLLARGIQKNSRIAIHLQRSPELIYSILGSLFTGSTFIPIPLSFPLERIKYIIKDVNADIIITEKDEKDFGLKSLNPKALNNDVAFSQQKPLDQNDNFYILYTSGSTGKPKGVPIKHKSISNYCNSVKDKYLELNTSYHMPLFTSIGFDLTMTSIFLPLISAGSISIYPESENKDLSILDVVENSTINCYKCTPSHLNLIEGKSISKQVKAIIVGGENFTRQLANKIYTQYNKDISIFNEYGPTEATIGCIVHKYDPKKYNDHTNVIIGHPLDNFFAFIANKDGTPLPINSIGELCIGGTGVADGYINSPNTTNEKFISDNKLIPTNYYRTGDLAKLNKSNEFEFFGRTDTQIKVNGIRIEAAEIEKVMLNHDNVSECVIMSKTDGLSKFSTDYIHCNKCGLPSNYPDADFDDENICKYCRGYDSYENKVEQYFKKENDFKNIFTSSKSEEAEYDCIMLYSGGKDSTYALGRIAKMGYNVLAFTLDNGYISQSAKDNITKVVTALNVDHTFGYSPFMNEIFVDSLHTHCNVCNGCFKTIYNTSLKLAHEKNIPIIVTGLTRGQFFETKLSEEIFWKPIDNVNEIDKLLHEARKAYHSVQDVAYLKTGGEFIENENVLDKVKIIDFYRYHDITLEEMLYFINTELPWVRPDDTGRSTNCLINKVGIHVHKNKKGYSNYAFPYSWDVRTGHKTKEETIEEIEEYIDEVEVNKIIDEIGYQEKKIKNQLVMYYTGEHNPNVDFRTFASSFLPNYMIPTKFIQVDEIPLTTNGKVDYNKLDGLKADASKKEIKKANTEIEELLLSVWQEVMGLHVNSIDDDFFELGGTSLDAIRITSRIEKMTGYKLPVKYIFEISNIEDLSTHIEKDMANIIASHSKSNG